MRIPRTTEEWLLFVVIILMALLVFLIIDRSRAIARGAQADPVPVVSSQE